MDYLAANNPKGLSGYLVSKSKRESVYAYAYGRKLQNRIWNFQQDKTRPPDAYLYLKDIRESWIGYGGPTITPEEMMVNPDYRFIMRTSRYLLFIRKDFFPEAIWQQLLSNYYKTDVPA